MNEVENLLKDAKAQLATVDPDASHMLFVQLPADVNMSRMRDFGEQLRKQVERIAPHTAVIVTTDDVKFSLFALKDEG